MATVHTVTTGDITTVSTLHVRVLRDLLLTVHKFKDLGADHVNAIAGQLVALEAVLAVKEADDAKAAAEAAAEHGDYLEYLSEQARNDPRY